MTNEFEGQENDVVDFDAANAMLEGLRDGADTPEMINFRRFFDRMNVRPRHFTADEFMVLGPSNGNPASACHNKNSFAGRDLWPNVIPLVAAMDAIRERLGTPIRITNCFRAPPYNSCVGGVASSQHLQFRAADFVCGSGNSQDWADAAKLARRDGAFSGGIGIYRSFVHVDVRGYEANWDTR